MGEVSVSAFPGVEAQSWESLQHTSATYPDLSVKRSRRNQRILYSHDDEGQSQHDIKKEKQQTPLGNNHLNGHPCSFFANSTSLREKLGLSLLTVCVATPW